MADLESKFEAGRSYLVAGDLLNQLIRELRLSRVVPGFGLREQAGPLGRVLHVSVPDTVIAPPFHPTLFEEGGSWKARLTPGYLEYQNIGGSALATGVLGYLIPTIGAASIEDDDPPPSIAISLASYCYLKVETTARGVPVEGSCEIIVSSSPQTSTHHRPDNGPLSTAREGEYYWLLFQTESDGGSPARPRFVRTLPGNKQLPNQLIQIEQIGGEVELLKDYVESEDKFQLRTLKALEGGSGGVSVLQVLEEPEDTINFKWVGPRASSPRINVVASGDEGIIVKGNDQSGTYLWGDCDENVGLTLEIDDGVASIVLGGEYFAGCSDGGDPETTEV